MKKPRDQVAAFLATYPTAVRDLAERLRVVIRRSLPDAEEMLDQADRVVGYGFGSGYADLICTIIPSKKGVKLGLVRGAEIADPHGLLEGMGKKHRYVALTDPKQLENPALPELLLSAVLHWRELRIKKR